MDGRAEADRFFNYPYEAIEESLVNAGKDNINKPIVTPHRYRNSRLGDSLKELELTEGRCTGFPKIRRALKNNGSPPPVFETDDAREYFMVTLKINRRAKEMAKKISPEGTEKSIQKSIQKTLEFIKQNSRITIADLAQQTGLSEPGIKKHLRKLQQEGLLKRIGPDKGGYWLVLRS